MNNRDIYRDFLLAFADDEHLMGQQHTEWIGVAPFLEEDLAFSSIGQDELGHALMLYEIVLELDGIDPTDRAIDELAFGRPADDYRSCHLVEYTTTDWAEALVRHWAYDTFESMRWDLVAASTEEPLRHVAEHAKREEAFHCRHADALLDVLLESDDAAPRILAALERLVPLLATQSAPVPGEAELVAQGVIAGSVVNLAEPFTDALRTRFGLADFQLAAVEPDHRAGRSADFAPLMSRMREVLDYDPAATW